MMRCPLCNCLYPYGLPWDGKSVMTFGCHGCGATFTVGGQILTPRDRRWEHTDNGLMLIPLNPDGTDWTPKRIERAETPDGAGGDNVEPSQD